ncbi:MAG: peptide chain release factor N(5)-glutamine methyltransferase [Woeseiaceae bacterium]
MNGFVTIQSALAAGTEGLARASDSPKLDAELLLARTLDVPRSYLIAHPEDRLDPAAIERYSASLGRRAGGVPVAYLTGLREFWSLELMVTPDTLIPRPETELLVERALGNIPRSAALRVLDLGTGSGAIALAIAVERPLCRIVAVDVSDAALRVARQNARQLDIPNVEFLESDWTSAVADRRFDLIVSNPPYVRADDPALATLRHEPGIALLGGQDGLDCIRRIAGDARALVAGGGMLLLEHGAGQQAAVAAILAGHGWREVDSARDLGGLPRVAWARAPRTAAPGE